MDNRPIGFFDSGLGGLTCIPHLLQSLPNERIIYFGDTARTPYGSKSADTITAFSMQITDFLIKNNVKMVVIACNTVTSTCLEPLREKFPQVPIVGIIEPAAKKAAAISPQRGAVGIIGTKATIKNRAYDEAIHIHHSKLRIFSIACPIFVPLIEEGIINSSIMDLCVHHYLDSFMSVNGVGTLVLGCTHYPLIRENIARIYPDLSIIDPSAEIIPHIKEILTDTSALADSPECENTFYASDLSENFINMINLIFEKTTYTVAFKNFDLDTL